MDEEKVKDYLENVPREIRQSIQELNNDKNWAIFLAVMYDGRKSFSELLNEFGANPNEINRALTSLRKGGLIIKRIEKNADLGDKEKYLYYSTIHGRKLLNCLMDLVPTKNTTLSNPSVPKYFGFGSSLNDQKLEDFGSIASGLKIDANSYGGQSILAGGIKNG